MSAAQHTPGPWTRSHLTVKDSRGMVVAEVAPPHRALKGKERDEDMEWCKANASLIAAAPELLEALIGLLAHSEEVARVHGYSAKEIAAGKYFSTARSAITKATGAAS